MDVTTAKRQQRDLDNQLRRRWDPVRILWRVVKANMSDVPAIGWAIKVQGNAVLMTAEAHQDISNNLQHAFVLGSVVGIQS